MKFRRFATVATLAFVIAIAAVGADDDDDDDEDDEIDESAVRVLTPKNFEKTIQKGNVLVEFYAPWCGHCKQLRPHYAKAALALQKEAPGVVLAKVNANKFKSLGQKFDVKGFPTLKWFSDGQVSDYSGGRTDTTIVTWIKRRLGPATKTLSTPDDHAAFLASSSVVVVGYFHKPTDANARWGTFQAAARDIESVVFATADDAAVHAAAGRAEGDVVLYKTHDGGSNTAFEGDASAQRIKDWVGVHQLAAVTDFSPESSSLIFQGPVKRQVLMIADKSSPGYDAMRAEFSAAARQYYGTVVAVAVETEHKSVLDYFGVTVESAPCVYAVQLPDERLGEGKARMVRYRGPAGPDLGRPGAVAAFISDMLADKIPPHKKSEPVPAQPVDEHGVTTLVGSNFEEVALDPSKDVLVEFYAPWCGHCKQLVPIYNQIGTLFKNIPTVVIAKMDATANDPPEGTDIQGFPTIKFYQAVKSGSSGPKTVLEYEGDRTVAGFKKFLKKNAGVPINLKGQKGTGKSDL